jgi:hypothetical protein
MTVDLGDIAAHAGFRPFRFDGPVPAAPHIPPGPPRRGPAADGDGPYRPTPGPWQPTHHQDEVA